MFGQLRLPHRGRKASGKRQPEPLRWKGVATVARDRPWAGGAILAGV